MSMSTHTMCKQPYGKNAILDESLPCKLVASLSYTTNAHDSTN